MNTSSDAGREGTPTGAAGPAEATSLEPPMSAGPPADTAAASGADAWAADARPGTVIGRYTLLEPIGEGGMGVVFTAEQRHPVRRTVALKVIKAGMDSRQIVARFEAERQALALMDHPNIAKVLDGGTTDAGRPYFVMELVPGVPVTEFCDRESLETRGRLRLFVQVCAAVQHAHTKGVIHRDIKPSNVLVTLLDGQPLPKVIDFGVAKATGQEALTDRTLYTGIAQMVGTPLYMSPEQAAGGTDIDTRSDVYSLGVLLYELLTGTTPFDRRRLGAAAYDEIRRIIREEEPPKPSTRISSLTGEALSATSAQRKVEPRKLGQLVRGELDWIVMRAMEKDRARRYETANGLGRDVERYLAGEPLAARPPTIAYFLRKRISKYRGRVTAAAAILVTFASVGLYGVRQVYLAREVAERRAEDLRTAGIETRRRLRDGLASEGQALAAVGRYGQAKERFAQSVLESEHLGEPAVKADLGLLAVLADAPYPLNTIELDPPAAEAAAPGEPGLAATITPDGRRLLVARGKAFAAWDLVTSAKVRAFAGHDATINALAAASGGSVIASAGREGAVKLWNPATAALILEYRGHAGPVRAVALSADGRLAASGGADKVVRVWDTRTGRTLRELTRHTGTVTAVAVSPDGRWVLAGGEDGQVTLWPVEDGGGGGDGGARPLGQVAGEVTSAAFSSDGGCAAVGYWEMVRAWHVSSGQLIRDVRVHRAPLEDLAFVPNSMQVLSAGQDSTVQWTDLTTGETRRVFEQAGSRWETVSVSADGLHAVSVAADPPVATHWGLHRPREAEVLWGHRDMGFCIAISPVAPLAASGARDGEILLWDLPTARLLGRLKWPAPVHDLRFSPDGRHLLAADDSGTARVWEVASRRQVGVFPHVLKLAHVAWSPDGRRVLSCGGGVVRLWDATTRHVVCQITAPGGGISCAGFWGDGAEVLTGGEDGWLRLWDATSGRETRAVGRQRDGAVTAIAAVQGGMALCAAGETLRLWDVAAGREVRQFAGHTAPLIGVAASPDGVLVASSGQDRNTIVWAVATGQELLSRPGGMWVPGVAFSADGTYLVSVSHDQRLVSWDLKRPPRYRAFARSLPAARAALRADPDDAAALRVLGEWYAFRGAGDWAAQLLERSRAKGGIVSDLDLARCYTDAGDAVAARRAFLQAIARDEAPGGYLRLCLNALERRPYRGTPAMVPGIIEAEEHDDGPPGEAYRNFDWSVARPGAEIADMGGARGVGWIRPGEWIGYTVEVAHDGTYDLHAGVSAAGQGGTFHVEFDGADKTGPLQVPDTGSWDRNLVVTKRGLSLTAGRHDMRVCFDSRGTTGQIAMHGNVCNLDRIAIVPEGEAPPAASAAEAFAGAHWIWHPEAAADGAGWSPPGVRYFRRALSLPPGAEIQRATLDLTVDDRFTLYVNGRQVFLSDGELYDWALPKRLNLTQHLVAGKNVLAVAAVNDASAATPGPNPAGVLARLAVTLEGAGTVDLVTDRRWKVSDRESAGWERADFDDAGWKAAHEIAPPGGGAWGNRVGLPMSPSAGPKPADPRSPRPAADAFAGAHWIWHAERNGEPAVAVPPGRRYLRRTFDVPADGGVKRAEMFLTADDGYTLHVNGREVVRHVGLTHSWRMPRRIDLTGHLRPGRNVLALDAVNELNSKTPTGDSPAGVLARLVVDPKAGPPLVVVSDRRWRTSDREHKAWTTLEFDDAAWRPASEVAPFGQGVWGQHLEPVQPAPETAPPR